MYFIYWKVLDYTLKNFTKSFIIVCFHQQWMGDEIEHTSDNTGHTLVNRRHTAVQKIGDTLDITVQIEYSGTKPTATAVLKNLGIDTFTVPPLPNSRYFTIEF